MNANLGQLDREVSSEYIFRALPLLSERGLLGLRVENEDGQHLAQDLVGTRCGPCARGNKSDLPPGACTFQTCQGTGR